MTALPILQLDSTPRPRKGGRDVLAAVAAKIPRALVDAREIAADLGLPLEKVFSLIREAERAGLVEVWAWQEPRRSPGVYCCLSASEAAARSLTLMQRDPQFPLLTVSDEDRARTGKLIPFLLNPDDWRWKRSHGQGGSAVGRRSAAAGRPIRAGHRTSPRDDEDGGDLGLEGVADVPGRIPPEGKQISWSTVRKRIRRRPEAAEDEARAYLRQFAERPAPRRSIPAGRSSPPGILIGLGRPLWEKADEAGSPCRVCRDRPLSPIEMCLGCCRTGVDSEANSRG